MCEMNYLSAAFWLLVIGASFGLGWHSAWLLALGVLGPAAVLAWGFVRWCAPARPAGRYGP